MSSVIAMRPRMPAPAHPSAAVSAPAPELAGEVPATLPGSTSPPPCGPARGGTARALAWMQASGPDPRVRALMLRVAAPVLGLVGLGIFWALLAAYSSLPGPGDTYVSARALFADPFYRLGPNDQGIAWNILSSLQRVGIGFGLAALVGIPAGFVIGRFRFLGAATAPVISLLRPVSPLAWLPIGLLLFKSAEPSAMFVIFICSIWPMVINTAAGVTAVPREYLDVARVLRLSEWTVATRILLPASLPFILTGVRLSVGIAWLAIVAAEMLTGGVGIGFWLWDEWNNLNVEHILIAIFLIGAVGLALEQTLLFLARRLGY